ncbi:L,D-transpeptidase [Notoacmeibacter sp. MSK16QG-6]|uniref:L,D-transpeptidase n=1 Tax=Notoacmeibacter sp. MSK16QG-6 TaxID=2957982 RepID=UPI00209F1CCE|nr:L,D-transpeptidase [Notoacmeibacter sp. MSK16QG-6]MCP1198522.1 L,D-transpeptidase [Notoacmeibacter sp. MSK16QG-6]
MSKSFTLPAFVASLIFLTGLPITSAQAQQAVRVSRDVAEPWIMQLQPRALPGRVGRSATRARGYVVRPSAPQRRAVLPRARAQIVQPDRVYQRRTALAVPAQRSAIQSASVAPTQRAVDPRYMPQIVSYPGSQAPGTIDIDTSNRFLYHVLPGGKAKRYGVGVGKPGFEWSGTHKISRKKEWPEWRPPAEMIVRERKKGRELPTWMAGGPANPLGARALYLGSSLYRIHGTNAPWTIGQNVSSGCIRMRNEDVKDLYAQVGVGTKVVVR